MKMKQGITRKKTPMELMELRESLLTMVKPTKNKINKILRVVGIICFVIAVIPNGLGFIFYPIAFSLLGISLIDIKRVLKYIRYYTLHGGLKRQLSFYYVFYKCIWSVKFSMKIRKVKRWFK